MNQKITRPWTGLPQIMAAIALVACISAVAQTDNFDSGSDADWQKSTTADYPSTFSFVTDVFGGKAYRLQAEPPVNYETPGQVNMARAVAVRTNQTYSDTFYVAADLVGWDTNAFSPTNEAVLGLIARAGNVTAPDQVQGVMLLTHWNQYDNGQRGTAQIYAMLGGGSFLIPGAQGNFTIERGRSYRMVFAGTNNTLEGSFYDLNDLTRPLLTFVCDDTYAPGFFPTSGYSGLLALGYRNSTAVNPTSADVTFDNFVAAAYPPPSVTAPATPHGMLGVPQVVNRSPASYTNFYPAAAGIAFNATTLTTTNLVNTNALRLFLNGVDVSSSLALTGPATNLAVSFSGLAPNCVYDARVELQDALGRSTTNLWTFDTFTDAYFAASDAKNIECEDYDFSGGQFYDNPIISGYMLDNAGTVNLGAQNAYADLQGTPGTDFFDWDGGAHTLDNEYRSTDPVGTQNGSVEYQAALGGDAPYVRGFDNLRQKYLAADPAGRLVECGVERTEGGEWLNYTRTFSSANVYNVYLRHGCSLTQILSLDQLGPEPSTNHLGTFSCVNALRRSNFRYAPLRDSSGKLAVLSFSGQTTLRLTLASEHIGAVKQGMWLNYLAFVPSVPQVYSAPKVDGPYTPEVNMLVDTQTRQLIVPQAASARFYRVGWKSSVQITGISISGGNVQLSYR